MPATRRSLQVLALTALLAGCGSGASPGATPTSPGTPSGGPASPTPGTSREAATPSVASASPSVVTTPAPTMSPVASPSPLGSGGFTTPIPPDPAAPWTGIRWKELEPADPLAHVRSVTRWRGGFVATGDLVVTGASARSKVWVSADGGTWEPLEADAFGPKAVVIGAAATADGVVVLTVQSGTYREGYGIPSEVRTWELAGPWHSWTSADGKTWTANPGPAFEVPRSMTGGDHPMLLAGAGNDLVALVLEGQPLAFTRDGIAWETASLDDFPGGPAGWKAASIAAFPPGFVSVGRTPNGSVAIASADGRAWTTSAIPETCPLPGDMTAGPSGLIVEGADVRGSHDWNPVWCSSLDGRSWRRLSGYPPVGTLQCEENGCPIPNGIVLGSPERMVAYRRDPRPAAWTSLDGRTWQSLAIMGNRPPRWGGVLGSSMIRLLLPIGLLFVDPDDGSAWLGTPET